MSSLGVICAELDRRTSEQERKSAAFDGRAGLVIAFCGALIGLGDQARNALQLLGLAFAALTAGFAGVALWLRTANAISVRDLRERYLDADEAFTRLTLLETRIVLQESDERRLERKAAWTLRATVPLALAVLLVLAGAIVDNVHG